jgi:hypothetical protein
VCEWVIERDKIKIMSHLDSSERSLSSGVGLGRCEFFLDAASGDEDEF